MEQMKQENGWADWLDQKECQSCRITYSIYSNFPPMPSSARAYNVETGEFFPFDRMRSLPTGFAMLEAQGLAWTCNCRGRSRTPPQNLGNAQPFSYQPGAISDDVHDIAARGVSAAEEEECDAMYEARMTYCSALSKMYGGDMRTYLACKDQAFQDYQACRGYR
ncbi:MULTISPECIES: hypothetical protein [unclassified Paraburkholderia]|uniref:hypothetical protein n=1 Tax=unclassified Paraburkholderia TaxID=2615204 RepID=UPI001F0369EF|nr:MULTISPECIES: hypothetical protein [unclassified Paraburkholderia]